MNHTEYLPFLKEGMKVKIIKISKCCSLLEGKILTLEKVFSTHWRSKEDGHLIYNVDDKEHDELELLTNPDGSPWIHPDKPQFSVGDRVRFKPKDFPNHEIVCGLITRIESDKVWWQGNPLNGDNDWCRASCLEKIEDEPLTTTCSEPVTINAETIKQAMDNLSKQWLKPSFFFDQHFTPWETTSYPPIINKEAQPQKKPTFMNSVVKALKDLNLSKEDRVLREQGFEDDNGKLTSQAREMMLDELVETAWDSRRKDIAKDLLALNK